MFTGSGLTMYSNIFSNKWKSHVYAHCTYLYSTLYTRTNKEVCSLRLTDPLMWNKESFVVKCGPLMDCCSEPDVPRRPVTAGTGFSFS